MTPHKLKKSGCLARAGDAVDRCCVRGGKNLYSVSYRCWRARAGGAGSSGLNCTRWWSRPRRR